MSKDPDFMTELCAILNRHSSENDSGTPDFILAEYLTECLQAWNRAVQKRQDWYGCPSPEGDTQ